MEPATFDLIKTEILTKAQAGVEEASRRCNEADGHLASGEYLGALGALEGLEERVRYIRTILLVLRGWDAAQNQRPIEFP